MASAVSNLLVYQGSDFNIDFTVENDNGTEFDMTGYTVASMIKKHYTSSSSVTVTAAVMTPVTAGRVQLSLNAVQTTAMKAGRYVYDVVITCLLYTSDAADEGLGVDLGGRRII